jgi:hypothetical protein
MITVTLPGKFEGQQQLTPADVRGELWSIRAAEVFVLD